jgi:hypothetical protein
MRILTRGYIALLFFSLLLSGCSNKEKEAAPAPPAQAQQSPAPQPQPAPAPASAEPAKAPVPAPSPSEKKAPPAAPKTPSTAQPSQPAPTPPPAAPPAVEPRPVPQPAPAKPVEIPPAPAKQPPAPAQTPKLPSKDVFILKASLGGVKFEHKKHATERVPSCDVCHHASRPEKPSTLPQQACSACHTTVAAPPMKTKLQAAFHNPTAMQGTCIDCHKAQNAQGKKAPVKCLDCHKKENS